ncbi:MAG: uncharacterized protein QOD09_4355 [Bradyrhizobium sp.]|jgi:uncharacterized protein|nr:uncharacterized protein [Bradyrhizobium sp.]
MASTASDRVFDGSLAAPSQNPVAPSQRIEALDVLRGLALFGVIAIHAVFEFRQSIFEQFLPSAGNVSSIDDALQAALAAAVELKAFALFSLLFGAGMAIQFDRLANHPRRIALLVRRLMVLLLIGAVHLLLIWNGDILVEYAVAGLIVLPLLFGPRWLALLAATAALVLFVAMPLLPPVVQFPSQPWIRDHIRQAAIAYGDGGFCDVLAFRIREIPAIFALHVLILPRTIALFLFGALLWSCGLLRRASQHRGLLLGIAAGCVVCGAALTLAAQGYAWLGWSWPAREAAERLGGVVLAAGYAATVLGLVSVAVGQRMLAWAAPVGRMAFTNYLVQSLILGWIFYGYGFGLFGRTSVTTAFAIGVGVYAMQAAGSAWWLERYRYGPVEWLWRSAMYGARQPMALRRR